MEDLMEGSAEVGLGNGLMDHINTTGWPEDYNATNSQTDIIGNLWVQAMFYVIYTTIFVLGITGNVLVCYVVMRNKAMQTVTNFFITNLALADILLCALAVPFTPIYTFLQDWIFGQVLCHLLAYSQGVSVYISTLTLMSIAIDRYFVIIYPFKPRMRVTTCFGIITSIWIFALLVTLPYGIYLVYIRIVNPPEGTNKFACQENWPSSDDRLIFSYTTVMLQFILPFLIMAFCYIRVSVKLSDRAKAKPGSKNSKKEAVERERKRRTNRMLIAMVTIFGGCWLPINLVNLWNDVNEMAAESPYNNLFFFFAHTIAMSSTCYNPFLYAWLNENFRKEFKQVLPCFYYASPASNTRSRRVLSERTCNGNETVQESFLPSTSQGVGGGLNASPKALPTPLETIEEQTSNSQSVVAVNYEQATAKYVSTTTNQVQVHIPDKSSPTSGTGGAPLLSLSKTTPASALSEKGDDNPGCNLGSANASGQTSLSPNPSNVSTSRDLSHNPSSGGREMMHPNSIPLVPKSKSLLDGSPDEALLELPSSKPSPNSSPFNPNFTSTSQPSSTNSVSIPSTSKGGAPPNPNQPPPPPYTSQMNLQITQLV